MVLLWYLWYKHCTYTSNITHCKLLNCTKFTEPLTLSWRRSLSNRNQSTDLLCKSIDWFLYDIDIRHERFKSIRLIKLQNRASQQQRLHKGSQEQQVIYYILPLQIVSKNNYELVDNYLHLQLQFWNNRGWLILRLILLIIFIMTSFLTRKR